MEWFKGWWAKEKAKTVAFDDTITNPAYDPELGFWGRTIIGECNPKRYTWRELNIMRSEDYARAYGEARRRLNHEAAQKEALIVAQRSTEHRFGDRAITEPVWITYEDLLARIESTNADHFDNDNHDLPAYSDSRMFLETRVLYCFQATNPNYPFTVGKLCGMLDILEVELTPTLESMVEKKLIIWTRGDWGLIHLTKLGKAALG
jgi:hypothetical protein